MSLTLLKQFWDLTKSDYKSEVIKIIGETAFYFDAEHVSFLFDQIATTPADKLGMGEFDCLCDLGKMYKAKEGDFQTKICNFFWSIILDSSKYKTEIVDNAIKKFSEMVKYWSIENKAPFFEKLTNHL